MFVATANLPAQQLACEEAQSVLFLPLMSTITLDELAKAILALGRSVMREGEIGDW